VENNERWALQAELKEAIESGTIEKAPTEKFPKWLISLIGPIQNDTVRHNAFVLAITANHYRTEQIIRQLEQTIVNLNIANDKSQKTISRLTVLTTLLAVIATIATVLQAISIFTNW